MSHLNPGLLSAYNSLTDKHLAGYFSNTRIRRHLQRAGLITRSGRIVPDKEYRHKLIQRAHQRHVRECLAQAIFHKVLEMERLHQIEIKRKLEEFARRERVHKIKVERSRRYDDDIIRILSPRPPTGVRSIRKQHSGAEGHSESSESPGSSRPNTAPGKMQRPVRLKPIHSNSTTASHRRSSPYNENGQPVSGTMDKNSRRRTTTMESTNGISPYCLPVINNFVTPVPPATKRKERGMKVTPSGTLRGRRLRPTTATSGADVTEDPPLLRGSVHQSRVSVTMVYFGKTVHLSHDLIDLRDEVKVFQQHCGGENLCVFKGKLREGETFQFMSRRHRGFPFSLTFFLNGLQVERLSSCCEFKHRKGPRLGGRHGHFGFFSVDGASPCYKCIIAMGLDKKPTPPPKRVKEEEEVEESVISPKDAPEMETEKTGEDDASYSDCETSPQQDMTSQVKEEKATAENNVKDEYEEDFEADDEGPPEEANEKKSASPSSQTELQVKESDIISETEGDENDEDIKSRSGSSCSGSDQEASDAEDTKYSREEESAEPPTEADQEDTAAPSEENDKSYSEEAAVAVAESGVAKESDLQDSAGDSTEIDISDTSIPSGQEHKPSDDTSGEKEAEETVNEGKQEEQERAKSVQEKLAEAILKSQCSSEPEMSDTSTEEEEEATGKGQEQNKNVSVTFEEARQTQEEETKCEESVCEAEEVQEETSEPKEQEDTTDKEHHENSDDDTKDETVKTDQEDENPASKGEAVENETSEDTGVSLQPMSHEGTAQEEENVGVKCTDPENEEADAQPDEMGQQAKGSEGDESAESELNKKTDEPAASGDAEAEVIALEKTMEMKAEPSEAREALSSEEAPVSDTEETQQGDSSDPNAASQTQVTAEDSSSSLEGSVATTVEKPVDASQDNILDGGSNNDNREAADGSRDGNQQEGLAGEINSEVEKSKEESKEGEEQANRDKTADGDNSQAKEKNEIGQTEEEEQNDESKTEESEENIVDDTKTDSNAERQTKDGPAEEALGEEDEVAHEEKRDESEKTERDEDSERIKNRNDETESESKGATADESNKDGEMNEAKAGGSEDKSEEAGKEEEDATEGEQSESGKNQDHNESEEKSITFKTDEGQDVSENKDEHEKNTDDVKINTTNVAESENIGCSGAADVAEMPQEISNSVVGSEDAQTETEEASVSGEKGEIDAENGEISTEAKQKSHGDDETEVCSEQEKDVKTAVHEGNEPKTEEGSIKDENAEVLDAECGGDAEKQDTEKLDRAPGSVTEEREVQEGDDGVEKQAAGEESKPDTIKEEREEMKQDENGNTAHPIGDNKDSDSASLRKQVQSSTPTASPDKHTPSNENDAAAAADRENGADADEASTTSEEGASVLLKPQAQDDEADAAAGRETPKALSEEDNTDLVTNWITTHQMSKFFETFVEPLEDLREDLTRAQVSMSSTEETQATELQRLDGPTKVAENEKKEQTQKDESEVGEKDKTEAIRLDLDSKEFEEEPTENDATKDTPQDKGETDVEDVLILKTENEDKDTNSQRIGSKASLEEDRIQEGPAGVQSDISKTDVESITDCNQSLASGKPESDTGKQSEEKTTGENRDVDEKQTETEGTSNFTPPSETEEHHERPAGPDGQKDLQESWGEADEQSGDVTEITDFTTSRSEDGSQEASHDGGIQLKPSDGRVSGELIQDIEHSHSKDRLNAFSVDERFGRSSYSLLSGAKTESLH